MPKKTRSRRHPRRTRSVDEQRRLKAVRREIGQDTYDEDDKLRIALDRMIDRLLERSRP